MYYPEELVEEVRSKNDIVEIISGYVKLQKKGSGYFGLCPFHNEKSPSFSVSGMKQMYYCFGCGAGGNVFSFLMNYENYTFPEALKSLAERAGVSLPEEEYSREAGKEADRKTILLAINKEAARYFYYQLRSKQGEIGRRYLMDRQLTEETVQRFGLGFANKTGNDLVAYLRERGYGDEQIIQAGLGTADERYGLRDKFWNRIIFPIMDIHHRVIGFGGRVMGEGMPKYLNSPETLIFDKSRNLYGLNLARTARKNHLILCEGYMDVIALHQAGFIQAVASLGTAFTLGQANLLKRYTEQVLLAYDSDGAGKNAALRAIAILRDTGLSGKVIDLSPYKDPDEFIQGLGAAEFQKRIEAAENSFLFEIRMLERDFDLKDPEAKTDFYRAVSAKLCRFGEELERNNYLETIAEQYQIKRESLQKMVESHAARTGYASPLERPKSGLQSRNKVEEGSKRVQRLLITWLAEDPNLYPRVKPYLSFTDFTDALYGKVAEKLFEAFDHLEEGKEYSPGSILNLFTEEEEQRRVAELFNTRIELPDTLPEREKAFHDILVSVKQNHLDYSLTHGLFSGVMEEVAARKAQEILKKTHISLQE